MNNRSQFTHSCSSPRWILLGFVLLTFSWLTPAFGQSDSDRSTTTKSENKKQDKQEKDKATKRNEGEHFMRVRRDRDGKQVALETSITRYQLIDEDGERVTVDLIGVVHIGEKAYYEKLNERFEQYDTLLYELVAPEGTVIPKGGGARKGVPTNPIAAMQKGMQSALGLEFQLEHIDYTKENFRHADMTPEEFAESMASNDESVSKYFLKALGQSMAMQSAGGGGGDSMGMLFAMFSDNKEIRMRKMFAKQIQNMESGMAIFKGKDGSTIIDHRNAKCMKVLRSEIASGNKNLAIFYGAGHLPDMERRLMSDFQMKRGGQTWLEAWTLNDRKKK